jgi:tRNA 2-thiouridine synthesizing protein E
MAQLILKNKKIDVDSDGFLSSPGDWDEDVAEIIAKREGIPELTESKREIVEFLRGYYQKNHSFPILKYVCKKIHAPSAHCVTDEFVDPMKAWKIAGLPKPPQVFFTSFDGEHFFANPFY